MGHTPYLLKPNLSAIYGATVGITGTLTGSNNSSTVTKSGNWTGVLPTATDFGDVRTDWLVITDGTYKNYCWRIKKWTTTTLTIDGTTPADISTSYSGGYPPFSTYQCVDARCAWTDPSTVTYLCLQPTMPIQESFTAKLQITRNSNAGHVAINLKQTESTKVFPLGYKGNYTNNENSISGGTVAAATTSQVSQLVRAFNYAKLYWPSTSPKYSNLFWYNGSYRSSHRDVYDVATTAWRMERCYMLKLDKEEDTFNNVFLKSLAVELV